MSDTSEGLGCDVCGAALAPDAVFCGSCGAEVAVAETSIEQIVGALEAILVPYGSVVLATDLVLKRPPGLEVTPGDGGQLERADRALLTEELLGALDGDGYLCAEVLIDGEPRACVWHVINDFVLPLVAELAGAVLGLYSELLPEEGSEESEDLADAPDLTVS